MTDRKMYIAIRDEVPDYMVPTLVAHSVINAHLYFTDDWRERIDYYQYIYWPEESYKKVTIRVNEKEYQKIKDSLLCWEGHEKEFTVKQRIISFIWMIMIN